MEILGQLRVKTNMLSRDESLKVTKAAARVLDDFGVREAVLAGGFTRIDPIALAERAGLHVMCRPMQQLLGAFIREEQPGILLNTERSAGMIHMTCAHELGHYFLNHESTADERLDYGKGASKHEHEADQFAYMLIAPSWLLAHVVRERDWAAHLGDPRTVYQLSLRLGLSYEATIWTLLRQRRIEASTADRLSRQKPIAIKRSLMPPELPLLAGQDVWILNQGDRNCVLQPRAGDRVFLSLPDRGSAGLLWQAHHAEQAGYTLRPLPLEPLARSEVLVGGVQQVLFEVEVDGQPGQVELSVKEGKPWLAAEPAVNEVEVAAKFEIIEKGLTPETKRRLIQGMRG